MDKETIVTGGAQCGRTTKHNEAVREQLIREFFDRLRACANVVKRGGLTCGECGNPSPVQTHFDHTKARAALDRLFIDLKDFAGEQKQNG